MTKLGSILKNRNITLVTKIHIVNAFAFPIVNFKKKAKVHPWGKERSVLFSNPLEEFPILIISEPSFFAGLVYFKTLSFTVF